MFECCCLDGFGECLRLDGRASAKATVLPPLKFFDKALFIFFVTSLPTKSFIYLQDIDSSESTMLAMDWVVSSISVDLTAAIAAASASRSRLFEL